MMLYLQTLALERGSVRVSTSSGSAVQNVPMMNFDFVTKSNGDV